MTHRRPAPRARTALWLAMLLAVAPARAARADGQPQVIAPAPATHELFAQFASLLEILDRHYLEAPAMQPARHLPAALQAFVRSLDPDAELFSAEEARQAAIQTDAAGDELGDVGLRLALRDTLPVVIAALDGSPAQNAGLLPGERILALDGRPLDNVRLHELLGRLRGPPGTRLTLTSLDPGSDTPRTSLLARAPVEPPALNPLRFLSGGVAYFRLATISEREVAHFIAETEKAETRRARGLILDLRDNPGGAFAAAQLAAAALLPPNLEIVRMEYADPGRQVSFVSDAGRKFRAPLVVLVNQGTAAEAELLAAALRDHRRAQLVGAPTAGRGRVMGHFALADGSVAVIPVARYRTPGGHHFDRQGLTPDEPVRLTRQTERSLATAGYGAFDWVNDRAELLRLDTQLARALELLSR
jgi:carboxyl-terminal processing protease